MSFFLRDSAYDYELVKQSVFYAKKCAARACWSVLARLCRGSSAAYSVSEPPQASGGCATSLRFPPLRSDSRNWSRVVYSFVRAPPAFVSCDSRITFYQFPHSVSTQRSARVYTYVHVFERIAKSRERRGPTPAGPSPPDFSTLFQLGALI